LPPQAALALRHKLCNRSFATEASKYELCKTGTKKESIALLFCACLSRAEISHFQKESEKALGSR
jgi:hypothetical protein